MIKRITLPKEQYIEETLMRAGYVPHHKHDKGYIKEVPGNKRFHAYVVERVIELHVDRLGKWHRLLWLNKELAKEKAFIYHHYLASIGDLPVFAPNLRELQKNPHASNDTI